MFHDHLLDALYQRAKNQDCFRVTTRQRAPAKLCATCNSEPRPATETPCRFRGLAGGECRVHTPVEKPQRNDRANARFLISAIFSPGSLPLSGPSVTSRQQASA